MTTAVCEILNAPAVAVKLADVAPAPTFTDAGTVSAAALLESATVAPPGPAACDSVTVQADVALGLRLAGVHETRLTAVGAISRMDAVCVLPLYVAVITAV